MKFVSKLDDIFSDRSAYNISGGLWGGGVICPIVAYSFDIIGVENASKIILASLVTWSIYEIGKGANNFGKNLYDKYKSKH